MTLIHEKRYGKIDVCSEVSGEGKCGWCVREGSLYANGSNDMYVTLKT